MGTNIVQLKADLFDIINEQGALTARFNMLEQQRQEKLKALSEALNPAPVEPPAAPALSIAPTPTA